MAARIAAALPLLLAACSRAPVGRTILAGQCMDIGAARQSVEVSLVSPAAGLLSVEVRERGISVVAAIGGPGAPAPRGTSPVDLLGTINLARQVVRGQSSRVRVASIDSPDISASVCVSAELLQPGSTRARARRLLATADEATESRDWQTAFDAYLGASRLLDHLGLHADAAAARHAMAELAYGFMQRDRDGIALIGTTLTNAAAREPAIFATRLLLLAKSSMDLPGASTEQTLRTRALLDAAARSSAATALGRRVTPRITIIKGFLAYRDGRLESADKLFDAAAAQCKALGDWECFAQARQNLAALAEQQQNYPAALTAYEQALDSLDTTRLPLLAADISSNLGRLEGRIGLFGRSAQAQRLAMRLYAEFGQCDRARRSESSLGQMLVQVGSVSDAATYLRQAATLDCARLVARLRPSGTAVMPETHELTARDSGGGSVLGVTPVDADGAIGPWDALNSPGAASTCGGRTFDGPTQNDDIAVFQALLSLSLIAKSDDRLDAARSCLAAAGRYSIDSRTRVQLLNASGALKLDRGDPRAAWSLFDRARRLSRTSTLAQGIEFEGATEIGLAEAALALGKPVTARLHAEEVLRLASARADVTQIVAALRLLALSDAASGHREIAIRTLHAAIAFSERVPIGELDSTQRATYLATQYSVFADLTDLLVGPGDAGGATAWSAFAVAERGHARSARYAIAQASRERASVPARSDSGDYRALLRTIASFAARQSGRDNGDLLEEISRISLQQPQPSESLDQTALAGELARSRAILVEYVVGRSDMLAFVTDGKSMHTVRLGDRARIAAAVMSLGERLREPEQVPMEIRAAARKLARLILWPIRPYLTRQRIIFVPDGTLHTVPFAALPWTDAASSTLVLQHAETSEEPSALLLARREAAPPAAAHPERFVLIGDPVLRDNQWYRSCDDRAAPGAHSEVPRAIKAAFAWSRLLPSLPGTRTEVVAISRIVQQSRRSALVKSFLGCAATTQALRTAAPGATVLHIATHGLIDARRPRLSALVLTPEAPSATDAAFQLLDILQLPLTARLVVLSACDTSQGRVLPGEGVLGLAQAFLQAGAQSVVASYWLVEDTATVDFMKRFYRHLLIDRLPVAAALRQTQLELAAASDSYSWAAFSLYGRADSSL